MTRSRLQPHPQSLLGLVSSPAVSVWTVAWLWLQCDLLLSIGLAKPNLLPSLIDHYDVGQRDEQVIRRVQEKVGAETRQDFFMCRARFFGCLVLNSGQNLHSISGGGPSG